MLAFSYFHIKSSLLLLRPFNEARYHVRACVTQRQLWDNYPLRYLSVWVSHHV